MGYDGQVHTTADGPRPIRRFFRLGYLPERCQLLGIIAPKEAGDMAQTLLEELPARRRLSALGRDDEDSGS